MGTVHSDEERLPDGRDLKKMKNEMQKEHHKLMKYQLLHNRFIILGSFVALLMVLTAIFAPLIATHDPFAVSVTERIKAPNAAHLFGTDTFGRDLFSRVIFGTRISVVVGLCVSVISLLAGLVLGLYSGYYRKLDVVVMRICDGLKAIPSMLLAIALVAIMGAGVKNVILSLSIVSIPDIARIARSVTLQVKDSTYIEALRASGAKPARIIWRNILPNVVSSVLVQISFIFATAVLTEASLSFLGVGVPVPEPSWGSIINEGKTVIYQAWWMIVFPGAFTGISVLGLNLLGDGLRDFLDPLSH